MEAHLQPNEIRDLLPQLVEGLLQCQPFPHVDVIAMPASELTQKHHTSIILYGQIILISNLS